MAVGVLGPLIVNAGPPHRLPRSDRLLTRPTVTPSPVATIEDSRSCLSSLTTMGSAEIYTMMLAVLLVGGVLWVISRFTHRD